MASINLHNFSSFDKDVEVVDAVCNKNLGTTHFSPWDTQSFPMCLNDSDHGTILYKAVGESGFTEAAFLSDGDTVNIM